MKKLIGFTLVAIIAAFGFAQNTSQSTAQNPGQSFFFGETVSDVLRQNADLNVFRNAILFSDLATTLDDAAGPYTLFAPDNDAFAQVSEDQLQSLDFSNSIVQGIYTIQVLEQMLRARGGEMTLPTVSGGTLDLVLDSSGAIVVDGVASIRQAGNITANGVVLIVDHVLPSASGSGTP